MEKMATRDAYGKTLVELGKEDPRIVVLDADLSKSTKTHDFAVMFPERFFNMGIAEMNMMGTAAGLAAAGKIPFASTFAIFATGRAFEVIRQSICYGDLNVKVVATHGGLTVGEDGASHQALEDLALMRILPGMTVVVPADAVETRKAVRALAAWTGPAYMRLGRAKVPVVTAEEHPFILGKALILREGTDVAFFACGIMVAACLEAASRLEARGIEAAVVNVHTLKPLDVEVVATVAGRCGAVVTAEEHSIIGGLGGAIAEALAENHPVPLERVGVRDAFGRSGTPEELLVEYGLTPEDLVTAAEKVLARKHSRQQG